MRGPDRQQAALFSYVSPDARVPADHPLRPIRQMVDRVLRELSPLFQQMYAAVGRPSIAPEQLLRTLLLQVFYSIRSERLLVEQLEYNLLFRWFVGLSMDEAIWDHSTFSKNRERLLASDVATAFFQRVRHYAEEAGLLSDEHFSVDGTLIDAWASMKSFQPTGTAGPSPDAGRNPTVDFRGTTRCNDTHQSTTDPDARLYRKGGGQEARLCYLGHVLMENRHGLAVDTRLTLATGTAEWDAAVHMLHHLPGTRRRTVGGDKGYDTPVFVTAVRAHHGTPHVARKARGSALDGRTTRHPGYAISQTLRKRVEEIFGWAKTIGGLRQTRHRGRDRVGWQFTWTLAAYNLVRLRNLQVAT